MISVLQNLLNPPINSVIYLADIYYDIWFAIIPKDFEKKAPQNKHFQEHIEN